MLSAALPSALKAPGLRREREPTAFLPYTRHVDDAVLALDSGALTMGWRLDGASFETADPAELNARCRRLNAAWRNLADDRLALWTHVVRRPITLYPEGRFRSSFAASLDEAYRRRATFDPLFSNKLFVFLVAHPGREPQDRAQALVDRLKRGRRASGGADAERGRRLSEAARDLEQHLARYAPTRLRLYDRDGLWFSEPLEALKQVMTGEGGPVPLVRGHLGASLYDQRLIFGRESLEIRGVEHTRYGAILAVKEYPASTRPGLWDALLSSRFAFVCSQSFAFLSKPAAQAVMTRKQNQLISARDRAASQVEGLSDALDALTSNRFVMGDHQASVMVLADDPTALGRALSQARATLASGGLVTVREDLGLEAAFWAQIPGNFAYRTRPAAITSRNFAALAPLHTHPAGRAQGAHWGSAVALLRTSAASPFSFNFHVGDVGHTFLCGPTGSGKTVVQNFLLAQLEKLGVQQVFIDKDRGADIFVRACGGAYFALKTGVPTGLAPLKAASFDARSRAFLVQLVRRLVSRDGEVSAVDARAIDEAVAALEPLAPERRSLSALRALLGQREAAGIGARLEPWCRGGPLGWALDGPEDALSLEPRFLGFDVTDFLDHPDVRTPILMYLLHRIDELVDGRRLVIDIDEFWKTLGDPAFTALAQDGLKTYRKRNAFMVFATQSPADVLRSPIAHTILEQCATKIFLPNPQASAVDYIDGFGLSGREFELIREELTPESRKFLVKQGQDSIVVELRLDGLDDALAVLSGRAETVALVDRLRAKHGDAPEAWLPHFSAQRRSA